MKEKDRLPNLELEYFAIKFLPSKTHLLNGLMRCQNSIKPFNQSQNPGKGVIQLKAKFTFMQ